MKLYVDETNDRRIGRILGIDHVTVTHWIRAHADQLSDTPQPKQVVLAEQDDLYVITMVDRDTGCILSWRVDTERRSGDLQAILDEAS